MSDFPAPRRVAANGIALSVHEQGAGFPVVLCHGWPELAYSWRRQIPALAQAGYRAIAPDQRGFGASDAPQPVESYDIRHLTGDLAGLLDALKLEKAVFVGHDWGGLVVWAMARLHPSRVAGVIGVNTPYRARLPKDPVELLRERLGPDHYIVFFQQPGAAERLFDADPARVIRRFQRRRMTGTHAPNGAFPLQQRLAEPEASWTGTPLLSEDEVQVYARAFARSGFRGGINWYRNISRNWRITADAPERIEVPCLMIGAADDPFLPPSLMDGMEALIPDLEKQVIADCGHWTQSEQPAALNRLMLDWLQRRFPA
jgi:pimeloyl-ACP methyl ester carboxylesterase